MSYTLEGGLEMTPKRILIMAGALLFATFVAQNAEVVEVQFLFWQTQASRALVLLGTLAIGLIAGWLTGWLRCKDSEPEAKRDDTT
jgi:uncharacterized integral membrane protein